MPDISPRPRHGLEADRAGAPEPGADKGEHLGLRHEVALDPLVDCPVEARPVLGGHPNYRVSRNF